MRFLFTCFLLLVSILVFSQKKWDAKTLAEANTAKNETYLTQQEKQVVLYLNLVRINPKLFSETFLKRYLDSTKENDGYTTSLKKTLNKSTRVEPLQPQNDLYLIAKAHAIKFGKENKIGHGDYDKRTKGVDAKYGSYLGENCDYGNDESLNIVMSLLIDQDISDVGHRNNILDPAYKFIGTSIQPHKGYEWNCVMDFGGDVH